ncbi:hypothetical protein [Pseudonocardia sp. TMWB2A]|uniref:hypothetical protein n=1 Tax=Pseudonocardia sp. TMWB2A TaxID=687430 RepID=UPI00307E503D
MTRRLPHDATTAMFVHPVPLGQFSSPVSRTALCIALGAASFSVLFGALPVAAHAAPGAMAASTPDTSSPNPDHDISSQQPAPPLQPTVPGSTEEEIIVLGKRWGQAEIASERDLDEQQIGAYGADDIGDLVKSVTPLIDGTGEAPVLLVNGKRITDPSEITGYPPEALARLAILPPEAAAHYGYPAGKRVVNLELKKKFASWTTDAGISAPTAGGRYGTQLSAGRHTIAGNTRWNAQASYSRDTMLRRIARDIPLRPEILTISQSVINAENGDIDPDAYETLMGASETASFNAGINRPFGDFSGSLNFNANRNSNRQLVGMPVASIRVPDGNGATTLVSKLISDNALESRQRSTSFGVSASVSGPVMGWQSSLSLQYNNSRSRNAYERGFDASEVQALVDAQNPSFDPYGAWPDTPLLADRTRSRTQSLNGSFNMSKSILTLPAGAVNASVSLNASRFRTRYSAYSSASKAFTDSKSGSEQVDGQMSFTIPVASRAQDVLATLGDLSLDVSASARRASDTPLYYRLNGGMSWSPFPILNLRASLSHENVEPSSDQRNGSRMEILNRVFDFARQEYVQALYIFGGNPDLHGGSSRNLSINAMLRPFKDDLATFNFGYQRNVARGGISALPSLTPEIEAAFPERVIRDASGKLVAVDARAINIAHDVNAQISSGVSLRWTEKVAAPDGTPPSPAAPRPWSVTATINHRWQLESKSLIRTGLPVIDRLRGSGQPRHNISAQLVAGKRGMGATLSGNWNATAYVRGGTAGSGMMFRYPANTMFSLSLFAEPEHLMPPREGKWWASNLRVSLDIQNLFNSYRRIDYIGPGTAPQALARDEIDPMGRTIRLSLRKQF